MVKASRGTRRGKGSITFDEQELAIYADYLKLKHNESLDGLSEKYGHSTRTIQRIVDKMEKLFTLLNKIAPSDVKKIPEIKKEEVSGEGNGGQKEQPGSVSRGVAVRRPGEIVLPTKNPLAGLTDMGDLGKVGVHTGVLLGGAVVNIRDAVVREDIPFEDRMLMMSQGSVVVANTALTVLEMLRSLGQISSRPIKEMNGSG